MTNINKKISLCGGGVVFRKLNGVIYFLLQEHKKLGWVLPKGHCEQNETPEQAAIREVFEETGFSFLNTKGKIGQMSYEVKDEEKEQTEIKTIYYYLFEMTPEVKIKDQDRTENEKIKLGKIKWFTTKEAIKVVSFDDTRKILRKALSEVMRE